MVLLIPRAAFVMRRPPFRRVVCPPGARGRVAVAAGERFSDRRSRFVGHAARVASSVEALAVRDELVRSKALKGATHNVLAFRPPLAAAGGDGAEEVCDDDGESGAGRRLLAMLEHAGADGVVVVASRWYGGRKLGAARFRNLCRAAKEAVDALPPAGPASEAPRR